MPQRENKLVYVLGNRREYDFADFLRHQNLRVRVPFKPIVEPLQFEPELTGITTDDLLARIITLENKLRRMQRLLRSIHSQSSSVQQKFVVIKELTHEQAKKIVEDYISDKGRADTEELMDLGIDLKLLVAILDELKEEGKIRAADEVVSST